MSLGQPRELYHQQLLVNRWSLRDCRADHIRYNSLSCKRRVGHLLQPECHDAVILVWSKYAGTSADAAVAKDPTYFLACSDRILHQDTSASDQYRREGRVRASPTVLVLVVIVSPRSSLSSKRPSRRETGNSCCFETDQDWHEELGTGGNKEKMPLYRHADQLSHVPGKDDRCKAGVFDLRTAMTMTMTMAIQTGRSQ